MGQVGLVLGQVEVRDLRPGDVFVDEDGDYAIAVRREGDGYLLALVFTAGDTFPYLYSPDRMVVPHEGELVVR